MTGPPDAERLRGYRRGHSAEWVAAAYLLSRGYRVLARRLRTRQGEIDLIVRKRDRIAFIEVKRRATRDACEAAITDKLRGRVRRAADLWLASHPQHQALTIGFDLVFVTPWRLPEHIIDAL
ncbi:MAG: YraN family protein [Hyphomicrobium sp.]